MLEALMDITFFPKESAPLKDWAGYDAQRALRPAFNLGGMLFSGHIISDEEMYRWNAEYTVLVRFFTIDTLEAHSLVKDSLTVGGTYNIQLASEVIGKAVLLDYSFN